MMCMCTVGKTRQSQMRSERFQSETRCLSS